MVKINERYYAKITSEPFEVQEIDGKNIELHKMNENSFYAQFANQGRFFFWSTKDSVNYKLVIEYGYYEAMKALYTKEINLIWLAYYEESEKARKRIFTKIVLPVLIVYVILTLLLFTLLDDDTHRMIALIGSLAFVFIGSRFLSSSMRRKFMAQHVETMDKIKKVLGKKQFEKLADIQDKYRRNFFKIEEEVEEQVALEYVEEENVEDVIEEKEVSEEANE
ncbi:MAG: hypothetical protein FWE36_02650 [Erysipelotrichales bacterium]|nr:hypothetical protein [Erysipelotrichales bacterium]